MTEFSSSNSYKAFASKIRSQMRYIWDHETEAFLQAVRESSVKRQVKIPAKRQFWRARLGHEWRKVEYDHMPFEILEPSPIAKIDMKPPRDLKAEGRINPKGIPCLYLATTPNAAISETRPWVDSLVSVGCFETTRELSLIDCSRGHSNFNLYFEEVPPEQREEGVWIDIDRAFAKPVARDEDVMEYVPTQVLAELFRADGADGVVYKSSFGEDGYNIALFDLNSAELLSNQLHKIERIDFCPKEYGVADEYISSEPDLRTFD
jgi:hypothetical protein